LAQLVFIRNHRQNRLVKRAGHHLHLAGLHQLAQPGNIIRLVLLDPFKQDAGAMQRQAHMRMLFQQLQKRQQDFWYASQNKSEITDGLVIVNAQKRLMRFTIVALLCCQAF
jgi:hypothetical protein